MKELDAITYMERSKRHFFPANTRSDITGYFVFTHAKDRSRLQQLKKVYKKHLKRKPLSSPQNNEAGLKTAVECALKQEIKGIYINPADAMNLFCQLRTLPTQSIPLPSNLFITIVSVISIIMNVYMSFYLYFITQIYYIALHIYAFIAVMLLSFIYCKLNNLQLDQINWAFLASKDGAHFQLLNKIMFLALSCAEIIYITDCLCFLFCNNISMQINILLITLFSCFLLISSGAAYSNFITNYPSQTPTKNF